MSEAALRLGLSEVEGLAQGTILLVRSRGRVEWWRRRELKLRLANFLTR